MEVPFLNIYFKWEEKILLIIYDSSGTEANETKEQWDPRGSSCFEFPFYSVWLVSQFFILFLCSFSPLLYIFSLLFSPTELHPPSLQPLQLLTVPTVFFLFLFSSPSLSQPGLFRYSRFFIFNHFLPTVYHLPVTVFACSASSSSKPLSLFCVLVKHCPWRHFFFISHLRQSIVGQRDHLRFCLRIEPWKNQAFQYLFSCCPDQYQNTTKNKTRTKNLAFWDTQREMEMDHLSLYKRILTSKVTFCSINKLMTKLQKVFCL